jgi:hypothetical protein
MGKSTAVYFFIYSITVVIIVEHLQLKTFINVDKTLKHIRSDNIFILFLLINIFRSVQKSFREAE